MRSTDEVGLFREW